MTELGNRGKNMVVKVVISMTKGAVDSYLVGLSSWNSAISRGLVCGVRVGMTTRLSGAGR